MESPLPCRVQEQVEHEDDENKYVFEDRSMMVRTPPPSYHYAVSTSRKNDDAWLARMSSLDETVLEMRRAVQDTQYMMKDIQNKYQKSTNETLYQQSSLSKKRLKTSKSFSSSSYSFPDDAVTINNNENDIKNNFTPIAIDNDNDSENNNEEGEDEQEENNTDDLDRIAQSLQQLIDQAQSSLKSKLAIRDRSYGSMLHRSNSCPQISTVFNPTKERRQSDTATPSTPQLFDWNGQRERFSDSQSKLAQAMHELAMVCCQDNLNNSTNNTLSNSNSLSLFQLPPSISSASSIIASSSLLQQEKQQENIIVQHHYHEHHHHHYYHKQEQNQEREKQHYQHHMGQILNYAWSSLRTISSNSTAVAAEAAARSSARLLNNLNMLNQQLIANDINKPLHIHPPRINLTKTNLLRLMVYISLLIFSFMNQQQQQQQNLSKKCITARRCIGQFVSHASENLPISTWIQHSTLLVYITTFL
ncbi:hypothetical protein BDC45DRAFT_570612 [Circinella umbellata]|nr:hypothetical protein BDC45DRAFT_570612 [Circinella umbellata]